ncbi:hypothetical protein Tco_1125234 [Tanacetum coccineum]|uniref:DNA-directed DNA polymerase n=1 Tax=Tanacetum coccineum TaxID=301880 RepID=A0ABQ5JCI8_9ASTR
MCPLCSSAPGGRHLVVAEICNYEVTCEEEAKRRNSGTKTKTFEESTKTASIRRIQEGTYGVFAPAHHKKCVLINSLYGVSNATPYAVMTAVTLAYSDTINTGLKNEVHGTLLDPFQIPYPEGKLTIEELINKFINEGRREDDEMEAFIKEFKTNNELLLKERHNSLCELRFEVYGLTRALEKANSVNGEIKGVTTRGGKTTIETT